MLAGRYIVKCPDGHDNVIEVFADIKGQRWWKYTGSCRCYKLSPGDFPDAVIIDENP